MPRNTKTPKKNKKSFYFVLASVSDVTIVDFHLDFLLMLLNEPNVLFVEQMPPLVLRLVAILLLIQVWIEWMPAVYLA